MAKTSEFDPVRPTPWIQRTEDGVFSSESGLTVYRTIPLHMLNDVSNEQVVHGVSALYSAMNEIADKSKTGQIKNRKAPGNKFKSIHILGTNTPVPFSAHPENPLAQEMNQWYFGRNVPKRVVAVGVPLEERIEGKSMFDTLTKYVHAFIESLTSNDGIDHSLYEDDLREIQSAFNRTGAVKPDDEQMRLITAWWNFGRWSDTPILRHHDHLHVFTSGEALRTFASRSERDEDFDPADCKTWGNHFPGQHGISFASVYNWHKDMYSPFDYEALWAQRLFDHGALAISIRGKLEPVSVTRAELRGKKKQITSDINERYSSGQMERAEQEELLRQLAYAEDFYSSEAPPTLTKTSVLIAFNGNDIDWSKLSDDVGMDLRPLEFRQSAAHLETQPASPVIANPHQHDLPISAVAFSGLNSVARLGDDPRTSAIAGFTEGDGQPAYLSNAAASATDSRPLMLIAGATGSGKTLASIFYAYQWAEMGFPVIFVNPKNNDYSLNDLFRNMNGNIVNLHDLATSDGIFDAFRFASSAGIDTENEDAGIDAASLAKMFLLNANPWGTNEKRASIEVRLAAALRHAQDNGAVCTLQALEMGRDVGILTEEDIQPVRQAMTDPLFKLGCGSDPNAKVLPLNTSATITLLNAGSTHFDLPGPTMSQNEYTFSNRVSLAALRLIVYGSGYALAHRKGVVFFDEAWTFLNDSKARAEIERLGRLARSLDLLPVMMTQRVADAVRAEVHGYISRVLALPLGSREEALAACTMLDVEQTEERLARFTAPKDPRGLNWEGMHALIDPETREVRRGTIALYKDLSGTVAPIEVKIPDFFVQLASTNPQDIAKRRAGLIAAKSAKDAEALALATPGDAERLELPAPTAPPATV